MSEDADKAYKDLLYGGVAGSLGKLVEYPFDTVKVRLQTQSAALFPTTWSCVSHTYKQEGLWRGFYQGMASPVFGAFLEHAVLFVSFNRAQAVLENCYSCGPLEKVVFAGAIAGACTSYVLTPVELVKCKLQVSNLTGVSGPRYTAVLPTLRAIVKQNGLGGLWQGQSGTFIRESAGGAVWFTAYEVLKGWLARRRGSTENTVWELLASGAGAGAAFHASIFPADTVKSTMQTEHLGLGPAVRTVLKKHGPTGFYRGVGITLLRALPANAVIFYVYESLCGL
ncbi:AFR146Wp [Eremothecium gossypii ATCC 10895]|uniref:AFR146Wp n=1 Tax=Eremothecium gossypii (strain ATCC 10895 / CBS 109.51 / FGSC 9923 / NRRL Y-1056) TaxID=284811 RepID=Q754C4_EREGS|nr:AFR146Wp [Eremothecium gossypii ATCC 10895]AAS53517.1 AFR146Wp [Eremothecium gossypii ATCC 10895]AEY97829.1 FAFR146Wp [Eremothecium gossypii FDAG1]